MQLKKVAIELLDQLANVVQHIDDNGYKRPLILISNATIGKHIRHTLEFIDIMVNSIESRNLSYDKRAHDKLLDTDRVVVLRKISALQNAVDQFDQNIELSLEVEFPHSNIAPQHVPTNLLRELTYNIEHLVHHMAILKIAIVNEFPAVALPESFGVAQSTLVYQAR